MLFYPRIRAISPWSDAEVKELLQSVERLAVKTAGELKIRVIERDPDDDKFVIVAVEGRADYIVSGDPDLTDLGSYEGVQIVSPAWFIEILQSQTQDDEAPKE